jgi:hypothetical protein
MFVKTLPVLMDCKDQDLDSFLAYSSDLINSVMKNDLYPFRILAGKYDLNANIQFQYSHELFAGAVNNDGLDYEIEVMEIENIDRIYLIKRLSPRPAARLYYKKRYGVEPLA